MRNSQYWQRRLSTARRELEDADRVWVQAMRRRGDSEDLSMVHVLWREREAAGSRVAELERVVAAAQTARRRRRSPEGLRPMVAFVVWHVAMRLTRPS